MWLWGILILALLLARWVVHRNDVMINVRQVLWVIGQLVLGGASVIGLPLLFWNFTLLFGGWDNARSVLLADLVWAPTLFAGIALSVMTSDPSKRT
jgi:hypothetical protein